MSEEKKIEIILSAEELIKALMEVQLAAQQTEEIVDEVVEESDDKISKAFMKTVALARSVYTIGLGMLKASGVSISYFFRSMISAGFGAVSILGPLLQAYFHAGLAGMDPFMVAQAVMGMGELSVAIMAMISAQGKSTEIARELRGAAMMFSGFQSLLTAFHGFS